MGSSFCRAGVLNGCLDFRMARVEGSGGRLRALERGQLSGGGVMVNLGNRVPGLRLPLVICDLGWTSAPLGGLIAPRVMRSSPCRPG